MSEKQDIAILRELAKQYAEISSAEIQDERRLLWTKHNSLRETRPMILCLWCCCIKEIIYPQLKCEDEFYRNHEIYLREMIFQDYTGDDYVCEPWINQRATFRKPFTGSWGLEIKTVDTGIAGGAQEYIPAIIDLEDAKKIISLHHLIDEGETKKHYERICNAVEDIIPVHLNRSPAYINIPNPLAKLRGMVNLMLDMYDNPEWLHTLLAHMRDGVLTTHKEAEEAGDWTSANNNSYSVPYGENIEVPKANGPGVLRKSLWMAFNAQEFTSISPEMHEEFMLRYQIPIMEKFGLTHYGCCEDLTNKISYLKKIPNMRRIAVTPWADKKRCAEQIGQDYILAWHPHPTDMGCVGFDPEKIHRLVREAMAIFKDCHVDIVLKDVNTVQGEPDRLKKWVDIVREETEGF